jgi:hypothetical protein
VTDFPSLTSLSQFRLTIVVRDIVTHLALLIRLGRKMWTDPTFAAYVERRLTINPGCAI